MRLVLLSFLFLSFLVCSGQKEILKDSVSRKITKDAVNYLNNYQFAEFDVEVEKLKKDYENHPAYPLLKSMSLYYQSLIDMERSAEDETYIDLLDEVVEMSEKMMTDYPGSREGVFFALTGYGYRAQYYSDQGVFFKAVGEGKKAYKYYKQGKEYMKELNEFYFMTGLFNYLIVQYPETHPIVKPLMGFFQKGDKELGLEYLDYGSKNAVFTKGSCFTYSTYLYTKYESDYKRAIEFSETYYTMYPQNGLNKVNYIIALLFNQDYETALPLILSLKEEREEYFLIARNLFEGWYAKEKLNQPDVALEHFEIVRILSQKNDKITVNLCALSCYKTAQIFESQKKNGEAKEFYKKALNDSPFEEVKLAYENFQKNNK